VISPTSPALPNAAHVVLDAGAVARLGCRSRGWPGWRVLAGLLRAMCLRLLGRATLESLPTSVKFTGAERARGGAPSFAWPSCCLLRSGPSKVDFSEEQTSLEEAVEPIVGRVRNRSRKSS